MSQVFNRHSELETRRALRNAMPPAEVILWKRLQRRQVAGAKFRRQQSVEAFVLDFYCPEVRLAIELDGPSHDGEEAAQRDESRQQLIESYGIVFLRFSNQEIYQNVQGIVETIETKVASLRQNNHIRAEIVRELI
ncbi:putative protein [Abditibacteriota bacterium]|nr:putative protein [Abditibacteriota bacterium]